jgi:pimeloyl-ACP methyl ester carboxylesterase
LAAAGHTVPGVSSVTLDSGLTLSYSGKGARSGPAVVLLPGPTDSWRSYQPVLERLPHAMHTIAVSQRGHGESDKPENGYRVEDFASDVVELLDALAIERAVLAGHSGSCLVARRVALDHPERVAGLLLEASPETLRHDARLVDFVASVVSNLNDPISPEFARRFISETSSENVPPDLSDALATELLEVPARVWKQMFAGLLRYEDVDQLAQIKAPTLLVWGGADQLINRETQDRLVRSIPGADLLVYPGAGHTPRWEDPERFSRDLVTFAMRAASTPA